MAVRSRLFQLWLSFLIIGFSKECRKALPSGPPAFSQYFSKRRRFYGSLDMSARRFLKHLQGNNASPPASAVRTGLRLKFLRRRRTLPPERFKVSRALAAYGSAAPKKQKYYANSRKNPVLKLQQREKLPSASMHIEKSAGPLPCRVRRTLTPSPV